MQRKKYISRPAKSVVFELMNHTKNYGIRRFNFRDLLINGDLTNLEQICDLIISNKLQIEWCGQGTVNSSMTNILLKKLKNSGFTSIVLGVESGSDKILEAMNKPFRRKNLNNLLPRLHKHGIDVHINLIVGYPGEDSSEFMDTCNLIKEHRTYIKSVSSLTPCLLITSTPLSLMKEKNKIVFPKQSPYLKWYTKDKKNTYTIRKQKLIKIVNLCKSFGIKTPLINLYDDNKDDMSHLHSNSLASNLSTLYLNSSLNMFMECLREHNLPYTIEHTFIYLGNELNKIKRSAQISKL
jgi:radical SAM superfamily enzyme YgiQ (UPF0313 family)